MVVWDDRLTLTLCFFCCSFQQAAGIRIAHHHHHHRSRSLPEDVGHGRYEVCEEGVRAGHGTA